MRSAEYDAFGPWIVPVVTPDLVPPLYRDHPLDLERAVMVLKVPRNITRRDATPDMDLYDHLVVVEEDRLELLSRVPGGYDVQSIQHSQVAAIDYGADLLDGWLTLFTTEILRAPVGDARARDEPALTLRYNAASEEIVERLVATLRRLALGAPTRAKVLGATPGRTAQAAAPSAGALLGLLDLGDLDIGLVTTQHAIARAEPGLRVLGLHGRQRIAPSNREVLGRIVDVFVPTTLHAAIVLAGDRELHVLRRRHAVARSRRPENSIGRTVLFLPRCAAATVRDDERFVGARVFSVPVGTAVVELVVPAGSSSERALVDALGVLRPEHVPLRR